MEINTNKDTKTATLCAVVEEKTDDGLRQIQRLRFAGYDTPMKLRAFLDSFKGVTVVSVYHIDAKGFPSLKPSSQNYVNRAYQHNLLRDLGDTLSPYLPDLIAPEVILAEDAHKHEVWDDITVGEC